ncbi:MAG: hypothetical protein AAF943_15230 [Pseudomonadota bacterium]
MSAILLTNPFAAPPPVPNGQPAASTPEVAAIPAATGAAETGNNVSSKGADTGAQTAKQEQSVALMQSYQETKRPPDATGDSVINAQAKASKEDTSVGPDLPEFEMPDPLPTNPIMLRMRDDS